MSSSLSQQLPAAPDKLPTPAKGLGGSRKFAKISQPRLHNTLRRERLFGLIDGLRERHAVLWIASPPGAGKTSLAASYVAENAIPAVWCQIDQGDADAATLFFFLAEAIKDTGPALPWNVAEQGSTGFERLFFRDFYARLPAGAVVVLDNVHEFDWTTSGSLLEIALSEVPDGITVLALSRDVAPSRLSRLAVSGRLAEIGWNELRFDADETRALLERGGLPEADIASWNDLVDGWVTGLVMLQSLPGLAGRPNAQGGPGIPSLEGREAVFRYFAGEIFERLPEHSRRLLMLLSHLPAVTADDAEKLTGDKSASTLLHSLYRSRLFVERRGADSHIFSFHALFREFLQHEAATQLGAEDSALWRERAAAILEAQGRIDEAAQLYQDAGAHAALAGLLVKQARDMLASGRSQTWRDWMSALPPVSVDEDPALWYWNGVSLLEVAPGRGRQILEKAEQAFLARGDLSGRLAAIAAIIDSFDVDFGDLGALPRWANLLDEGVRGLLAQDEDLDAELDLRLHSRLTAALMSVKPDAESLAGAAGRALRALARVNHPAEQLAAGAMLLRYFDAAEKQDTAARLVAELGKLADDPHISPYQRVKWHRRVAWWYNKDGHFAEAGQWTGAARSIVAKFDLDPLAFQLLEVHHLLGSGDMVPARALLDQVREAIPPGQAQYLIEFHGLEANWRALSSDLAGALEAAQEAVRQMGQEGLFHRDRTRLEIFLAACHALRHEFADARLWLERAVGHSFGFDTTLAHEARAFIAAYEEQISGDAARARALLDSAWAGHRQRKATVLLPMTPQLAARLAALALEQGIELAHVGRIIVHQRLCAPSRHAQNWPWPVAVRSLGKFDVRLNGEPVNASGKAQQRPLALLRALLAAGESGRTQQRLVAQLWPAAEDARSALNVTVHRLRKLLGSDELITVAGGNVQLEDSKLWSDVSVLAELCSRIDQLGQDETVQSVERLAADLLAVYRGPFCDGSDDSWVLAMREQCRNRFLTAVAKLGARIEAAAAWATATKLYQRALEAEPLAETTYRNLMRCAAAQNDPAAAFSIYRRCRETLSIVLGRQPSSETVSLAKKLGIME